MKHLLNTLFVTLEDGYATYKKFFPNSPMQIGKFIFLLFMIFVLPFGFLLCAEDENISRENHLQQAQESLTKELDYKERMDKIKVRENEFEIERLKQNIEHYQRSVQISIEKGLSTKIEERISVRSGVSLGFCVVYRVA